MGSELNSGESASQPGLVDSGLHRSSAQIVQQIRAHAPKILPVNENRVASVALILRNLAADPEILFIERAKNPNDPWSGQIAFPGGNKETSDKDAMFTACRETQEEVGLMITDNHVLGRLDDQQGRSNYRAMPLIINCFVFEVRGSQQAENNYEVADSFWTPISYLLDQKNKINYQTEFSTEPYPGVQLKQERVLWGLTYRFVQRFFEIVY